jgi:pimeloyl-ACP methyl ester carboxylesterase
MHSNYQVASGRAMLAVEVAGSGDPVVFLHAVVGDRRMWRAQLEGVGASNKAIAYDRRGFGQTRADAEDFSAVEDLMAVIDATADGKPVILVGCSQGGRFAIDAALRYPSRIRALVLIAPSVSGAPDVSHPREIKDLMDRQKQAEEAGDPDLVNAIRARLWLDGPLAPEGRVMGQARELFLEMNGNALRLPPIGSNLDLDSAPAFHRLGEISAPSLLMWGDLDFPHIQERSRHMANVMPNGSSHVLAGAAHVPSLERPEDVMGPLLAFIGR